LNQKLKAGEYPDTVFVVTEILNSAGLKEERSRPFTQKHSSSPFRLLFHGDYPELRDLPNKFTLYDLYGRRIDSFDSKNSTISKLKNMPRGLYWIKENK